MQTLKDPGSPGLFRCGKEATLVHVHGSPGLGDRGVLWRCGAIQIRGGTQPEKASIWLPWESRKKKWFAGPEL